MSTFLDCCDASVVYNSIGKQRRAGTLGLSDYFGVSTDCVR